jgi:hypothetical protein
MFLDFCLFFSLCMAQAVNIQQRQKSMLKALWLKLLPTKMTSDQKTNARQEEPR